MLRFSILRFGQRRLVLQAAVTRFVNSKGHGGVVDAGHPVRVELTLLATPGR